MDSYKKFEKNIEEVTESFKNHPTKTVIVLIVMMIIVILCAYISGFFGEKGKKHAGNAQEKSLQLHRTSQNGDHQVIQQDTRGNQSPAIVSDQVNINFESGQQQKDLKK